MKLFIYFYFNVFLEMQKRIMLHVTVVENCLTMKISSAIKNQPWNILQFFVFYMSLNIFLYW